MYSVYHSCNIHFHKHNWTLFCLPRPLIIAPAQPGYGVSLFPSSTATIVFFFLSCPGPRLGLSCPPSASLSPVFSSPLLSQHCRWSLFPLINAPAFRFYHILCMYIRSTYISTYLPTNLPTGYLEVARGWYSVSIHPDLIRYRRHDITFHFLFAFTFTFKGPPPCPRTV